VRAELEKSDALYVWLRDKPRLPRSANTRRTATTPTAASRADKPFTIKAEPNIPVGWVWIGLRPEGYGLHGTSSPGFQVRVAWLRWTGMPHASRPA